MNRIYLTAVSALALFAMVGCSKGEEKKAADEAIDERPIVEVQLVSAEMVPQVTEYTATVEADKTNNISSSTPNRIKQILVDVGSVVGKGQKLVVLDNANIDQLKVRLDNTERQYNRAVQLLEIGGGTQQAVDQLKTELDAARRQYANMLENTVLVSPISGVVTARNYDPGDMTGQLPILTIEQLRPVKVLVNVNEAEFSKVHRGMKVDVQIESYGDENFTGTVGLIHPTINPQSRTFVVEVMLDNRDERIRPGMFARVFINFGAEEHVVVPDRAVVKMSGSGNRYVYVYDNGKVSYNKVELGRRLGDSYELISGVENGSQVVITGQSHLADGIEVQLANKEKK